MRAMLVALASIGVMLAGTRSAQAQVLVVAERDLQFGLLMPGVPTIVPPTDLTRSAQLRIDGRGTYQVTFQLPASLTAPGGQQIPLVFGGADGLVTILHATNSAAPDFYSGGCVFECFAEEFVWILAGALCDEVHGIIEDVIGHAFFAFPHQVIDKAGDHRVTISGIGLEYPQFRFSFPHDRKYLLFLRSFCSVT
jgi:hypothetical protein